MLVNPAHAIPDDFTVELSMTRYGYKIDSRIVSALDDMITAAAADSVILLPCYGYRTREQSQQLFEKQISRQMAQGLDREAALIEAAKWVAPPGHSEHHTGLALDIVTPSNQVLTEAFATTDAAKWMAQNGHRFGFILRYPKEKQDITGINFEPWHMRYVGLENASIMFEQGLCLEEYLDSL
ncbi:MAG: M15 family metallopeptidase [Oscillospiraceae bacterium]